MRHIRLAAVALCAVDALLGTPVTFTSGTLLWAPATNFKVYDVTGGANLASAAVAMTASGTQGGQIAFAPDLTAAYVTGLSTRSVFKYTPGNATPTVFTSFNTGTTIIGALGLVISPEGRIYMSGSNNRVYDITNGSLVEIARGLSGVRNMLWTPNGILIAEQYRGEVTNIGFGNGDMTDVAAFATGMTDVKDIVMFKDKIYATGSAGVWDITNGGTMTLANRFAWGQNFLGLAATKDKLYAVNGDASPRIFDITAGGAFVSAQAWGYNLPALGDTMFDAVPYLPTQDPPPPATVETPEGPTLNLMIGGLLMVLARRPRT